MTNELTERLLKFTVDIIVYLRIITNSIEAKVIKYQLIKSATSSGANYEEAQGASSKMDFHNKVRIALKEMRESKYWLMIIRKANIDDSTELNELINESEELKNILGKIASKTRNKY